jgi:hypothetical protein
MLYGKMKKKNAFHFAISQKLQKMAKYNKILEISV